MASVFQPVSDVFNAVTGQSARTAYNRQANEVANTTQQANNQLQVGYNAANTQLSPYAAAYQSALLGVPMMQTSAYQNLTPDQQQSMMAQFQGNGLSSFMNNPGYQFALQQGQQLVNNSAAAQGNLLSGASLQALTQYGQGMANQQYQNFLNNLNNAGASNALANYGMQLGGNQSSVTYQGGLNQATTNFNAATAKSNAINSLIKQGIGLASNMGSGGMSMG